MVVPLPGARRSPDDPVRAPLLRALRGPRSEADGADPLGSWGGPGDPTGRPVGSGRPSRRSHRSESIGRATTSTHSTPIGTSVLLAAPILTSAYRPAREPRSPGTLGREGPRRRARGIAFRLHGPADRARGPRIGDHGSWVSPFPLQASNRVYGLPTSSSR